MIVYLKANNISGQSYELHLTSNRKENTLNVGGVKLFSTYYVTANGNASKMVFTLPILLLKSLNSDLFRSLCKNYHHYEEGFVEIKFLHKQNNTNTYHTVTYSLTINRFGFLEERIDNKILPRQDLHPYKTVLSETFVNKIRDLFLILDFDMPISLNKAIDITSTVIGDPSFHRFTTSIMDYCKLGISKIKINQQYNIEVTYTDGTKVEMEDESLEIRSIYAISSFIFTAYKTGKMIVGANIDKCLSTSQIERIIRLFNDGIPFEERLKLPCQLLLTLQDPNILGRENNNTLSRLLNKNVKIYKEQLMVGVNTDGIHYWKWKKHKL